MSRGMLVGTGRLGELFLVRMEDGQAQVELLLDPEAPPPAPLRHPPMAYVWPTWTGSGDAVLASTLEATREGEPVAQVLRYDAQQRNLQVLYRNPPGTGMVGPGLPHYLNPSPDGAHVALLAQTMPGALSLIFLDARGRGPAQAIARGTPLFTAWSPSSDTLLLHAGGELSSMELASAPSMQLFASNHVGYRVPAWSPAGDRIAVSAQEGPRTSLLVLDRSGRTLASLAPSWPTAAVAWSPDGGAIAHAQMTAAEPPRYGNLQLVDANGGGVRPLYSGAVCAYAWAPQGERLAVLVPSVRPGAASWLVLDRTGKTVQRFPPFLPTAEFDTYTSFFDQYTLSHRLWSADGSMLLAAGRMQHNGTPIEHGSTGIYVFALDDGSVRQVATGVMASWSPRAESG
jgi:hypothetical protein